MCDGNFGIIDIVRASIPGKQNHIGEYVFYTLEIAVWAEALTAIVSAYAERMIPLRIMAMLSNVLGVVASVGFGSPANVVKHVVNFPLNAARLRQMRHLIAAVRHSLETELKIDWLKPFMRSRLVKAGEEIFARGDEANEAYLLVDGRVEIPEASVTLNPGEVFGEMALFTETGRRTASAVSATDAHLLVISYNEFAQVYFQNPEFGLYLVRLIIRRLEMNSRGRDMAIKMLQ
jgi:CRP/FNR family cyclic AMP-dependent transcriptional regulator